MSAIIRVTDIGRPGQIIFMPSPIASEDFDFIFQAAGPTPERITTSTSFVVVNSGSFTIPEKTWIHPSTNVDYLFVAAFDGRRSNNIGVSYGRVTIDGYAFTKSWADTSYIRFYGAFFKKPNNTTINWTLEIRTDNSSYATYVKDLKIYYSPIWRSNTLYSKDIGTNTLLVQAIISEGATIRIDDEYLYRNATTNTVVLNFNLLPFYKIEMFGNWIKLIYLRVD